MVIKHTGAAYLIFLAFKLWREKPKAIQISRLHMFCRIAKMVCVLGIIFWSCFLPAQSALAESLFESNADTRFMITMSADRAALQEKVPDPWQVVSIPDGPFKGSNLFMVFIDPIVVQDAKGEPNLSSRNCRIVFAVPAENKQTHMVATMNIGGFTGSRSAVPGPYKNFKFASIERSYTRKTQSSKPGMVEDTWYAGEPDKTLIELRVKYQASLPLRNKAEMTAYSAKDPDFFRIYRLDTATEMIKSVPMNVDRIQDYQLKISVPEVSGIFDGTEQVVAIMANPLYVRKIYLP